jgi:hypothetical protein
MKAIEFEHTAPIILNTTSISFTNADIRTITTNRNNVYM